ncbi:TRP-like ion channel Pkd2 [Cymbomonas tetramitiformis]|uniref:TRP-like ion channel Pkd2 n=1 Tax=Cymbomonas tetramitiformis TaxID=36881 RepID=A0AAE0BAV9_9CHLO|nr:TRP-like ion channel Pkd2 [Cymbomonas tetramitiformis]
MRRVIYVIEEQAEALRNPGSPEAAAFVEGVAEVLNDGTSTAGEEVAASDVAIVAVDMQESGTGEHSLAVTFTTAVATAVPPTQENGQHRNRRSILDEQGGALVARSNDVAATLTAAARDGRMSASLAQAATSNNASLSTEVAGLAGEPSYEQLSPEVHECVASLVPSVDLLAAYMTGIEQGIANLKRDSIGLDDSLAGTLDTMGLAGGSPTAWSARLTDVWLTAADGDEVNIEALMETAEDIAEKLVLLIQSHELSQDAAYEADLRLAAAVNITSKMLLRLSEDASKKPASSSPSPPPPPPSIPIEQAIAALLSADCSLDVNSEQLAPIILELAAQPIERRYTFAVEKVGESAVPVQSESRRQLLAKKSAGQEDEHVRATYWDYTKHDDWTLAPATRVDPVARLPAESQARYVALERNRLVGGLLLHVQRKQVVAPSVCTRRFQHLVKSCYSEEVAESFGTDTVFSPGASLYRPDLQMQPSRDQPFTENLPVLLSATGCPDPYQADTTIFLLSNALLALLNSRCCLEACIHGRSPPGPCFTTRLGCLSSSIDTGLGAWRAQELYNLIEEGSYIDESISHLEAVMLTWNAQRQAWGFLQLDWSSPAGASALWLLLHVLWVVVSLAVFAKEVAGLTPRALEATYKQDAYLSNLMTHYCGFGRVLASCGACLQLVVLGVFFAYHYSMLHVVQQALQYNIYHDLHAGANFFLSAREAGEAEPSASAEPDAAALIEAGVPPWTRPEDNSGLEEYAENLQQMRQLGALYQLFFMLQALRTLIMMLRMLNTSMGQKRLAVVSKTVVTSFGELIQCIPFFTSLGCFAILFNVELGHRLPFFSNLSDAFRVVAFFAFLGDYKSVRDEGWEDSGSTRFKEDMYIVLFVVMYMFFLGNFIMAIVCDSVYVSDSKARAIPLAAAFSVLMMVHWKEGKDSATTIDDLQLYYKNRVNRLIIRKCPSMERVLKTLLLPEEHRKREKRLAKQKHQMPLSKQMPMKLKGAALAHNEESSDDRMITAGASTISSQRLVSLLAVAAEEVEASVRIRSIEEELREGKLEEVLLQLSANLLRKLGVPSSQAANTTKNVHMDVDVETTKRVAEGCMQSLFEFQQKMERKQQMTTEKLVSSIEQVLRRFAR